MGTMLAQQLRSFAWQTLEPETEILRFESLVNQYRVCMGEELSQLDQQAYLTDSIPTTETGLSILKENILSENLGLDAIKDRLRNWGATHLRQSTTSTSPQQDIMAMMHNTQSPAPPLFPALMWEPRKDRGTNNRSAGNGCQMNNRRNDRGHRGNGGTAQPVTVEQHHIDRDSWCLITQRIITVQPIVSELYSIDLQSSMLVDCGATNSAVRDGKHLVNISPLAVPEMIRTASNDLMPIKAVGTLPLTMQSTSGPVTLMIGNVAVVPDLKYNVLATDDINLHGYGVCLSHKIAPHFIHESTGVSIPLSRCGKLHFINFVHVGTDMAMHTGRMDNGGGQLSPVQQSMGSGAPFKAAPCARPGPHSGQNDGQVATDRHTNTGDAPGLTSVCQSAAVRVDQCVLAVDSCEQNYNYWHNKSHASAKALSRMSEWTENENVKVPDNLPPCDSCKLGAMREVPKEGEPIKADFIGDLVTADIKPVKTSIIGNLVSRFTCFMLFVCVFTRAAFVYVLSDHSANTVSRALKLFRIEYGHDIHRLRTDNGGEFHSRLFCSTCTDLNIKQEFSAAHHQHQNGIVERSIGIIVDMSRKLLHQSGLWAFRDSLWPYAVKWATYLRNRMPHAALSRERLMTPIEALRGVKSDYKDIHAFGALAYVHQPVTEHLLIKAPREKHLTAMPEEQ
ncbi:unnamed protein product [Vitrella brassicaformis CCMP3155]|uniref:Integrase catalytic domain-containing protein n=1 Tax=Vitrella brassicaformis (strain CCMP3155) TaxID=1169540 RepID=A0A0G4H377_VITBC|nr:unnamed protein product [Vitrella brassicaformis CCMP3155]|eukprot:CEM37894.1 unnamed protein product [Vitrella brassicaformis CCMP3155]